MKNGRFFPVYRLRQNKVKNTIYRFPFFIEKKNEIIQKLNFTKKILRYLIYISGELDALFTPHSLVWLLFHFKLRKKKKVFYQKGKGMTENNPRDGLSHKLSSGKSNHF